MIHDTMCGDNRYVMQKMGDANSNAQKRHASRQTQ